MSLNRFKFRRGLTLIELVLALAITAMVAAAIAAMVGAITSGEMSRRDNRDTIVRTYTATTRLSAYIASCMSVLEVGTVDEQCDSFLRVKLHVDPFQKKKVKVSIQR